jgi:hypothetical protein
LGGGIEETEIKDQRIDGLSRSSREGEGIIKAYLEVLIVSRCH